jgi:hypothetical protein
MTHRTIRSLFAACAVGLACLTACATRPAIAGDRCTYRGTLFSDGAAACQSGTQYRCDDGEWRSLGTACPDRDRFATAETCRFDGNAFSAGSVSCQAGIEYRCEGGVWHSLGTACRTASSPTRAEPSDRICMYEGATVASGSTMCRSGATFRCDDGEWTNVGSRCQ